jgi:hypothetical protein
LKFLTIEAANPNGPNPVFSSTGFYFIGAMTSRADTTVVTIKNLTFRNFTGTNELNGMFSFGDGTTNRKATLILDGTVFENCSLTTVSQTRNGRYLIGIRGDDSAIRRLIMKNSTVRNCRASQLVSTGTMYDGSIGGIEIHNCSFYNNILLGAEANRRVLYFGGVGGSYLIYNNTFSSNTSEDGGNVINELYGTMFLYNTLYNSGSLSIMDGRTVTAGNIILNGNYNGISAGVPSEKNIFSAAGGAVNYYYYGLAPTVGIFGDVVIPALNTDNANPGMQHHQPVMPPFASFDIRQGWGFGAYILSSPGDIDQLGLARTFPYMLGSTERVDLALKAIPPVVFVMQGGVITTPAKTVNLADYLINLPIGQSASFGGSVIIPGLGSVVVSSGGPATITTDPLTAPGHYQFTITATAGGNSKQSVVDVYVVEDDIDRNFPGYIDPGDITACYDYMGNVIFSSRFMFRTDQQASPPYSIDQARMAWSTIPVVADLNHDGYPEIVALSIYSSGSGGNWNGILIHNGRTGAIISRLEFKNSGGTGSAMRFTHANWHSATPFALVDSDRDGTVEMIIALPNGSTNGASYINRLVSYKIVWNAGTGTYSLQENTGAGKWASWPQYNVNVGTSTPSGTTSNFHKGVPQICDLDGDGQPEILIYNKIYSAVTGALLIELESLGSSVSNSPAYMGLNGAAYEADDRPIPLPAVYDIDRDGIYDVVAGGKIYKITKSGGTWGYNIIAAPGGASSIGDGYTAVADVDGDGLPDAVVARQSGSNIIVTVWNPTQGIIASRLVTVSGLSEGSLSYVFIGDIDGHEQNGVRLPEIAILTGRINLNSLPLHPNISSIPQGNSGSLTDGPGGLPNYGGLPTSGVSPQMALFALTIDLNEAAPANRLKLSFMLEHEDLSTDTGFTTFDFDNDGINEICYRDMYTLRIIKPVIPYIKNVYVHSGSGTASNNHPEVILLSVPCGSRTGYEYAVIADIDNDASADMIVPGGTSTAAYSHIYAVSTNGDKFAPAWPVWNQYMYDPFKITPDSLTTPIGLAPDRLQYKFLREIKNTAGDVVKVIPNYQPFNGNMIQATYVDPTLLPKFEPLVYLTDAHIYGNATASAPRIRTEGGNTIIELRIGNLPSANATVTSNTPIAAYKNNAVTHASRVFKKTLAELLPITGGLIGTTPLGDAFTLAPGEDAYVALVLGATATYSPDDVYIVRLADDSEASVWRFGYNGGEKYGNTYPCADFDQGLGVASKAFRDCNWCNQTVRAAKYQTIRDAFTIQEFDELSLDVLSNDILPVIPSPPSGLIFTDTVRLGPWNIVEQPKAGYLAYNNVAGLGARIVYRHDNRDNPKLNANIDSFRYSLTYYDIGGTNALVTKTATVYIYIMKSSSGGFSTCYNKITDIRLDELPFGIRFNWLNSASQQIEAASIRHIAGEMKADSVYYLKPITTGAAPIYQSINFPYGKLTVRLTTYPAKPTSQMRWTGHANRQWRDPRNWVEILTVNGRPQERPVEYSPSSCSNVIIPAEVNNFPELTDSAECNNIELKNRAMLRNPHVLKYAGASVELKLEPSERDRFVMWSAPLIDMYSGDYHYRSASGPQWGDVFMNLFQTANPFGPSAAELNRFTATIAAVHHPLPLGTAFNLKVATTTVTRDSLLRFPRTDQTYTVFGGDQVHLPPRANPSKFITHGKALDASGKFNLPVYGDIGAAAGRLLQVVNPYMAYLHIDSFLNNNTALVQSGYYIWNGETGSDISVASLSAGNRITVTNPAALAMGKNPALIPPLQSFFIAVSGTAPVTSVKMSPNWTITAPVASYILRAATMVKSGGVMNISLHGQAKSAHAAVVHAIGAGPSLDRQDMPAVIHAVDNQTSLALYTFSAGSEPLAINCNEHFAMTPVNLGMTLAGPGEYRLEFANLETFGYNVTLVDKQNGGKQVDLNQTPQYSFAVAGNSSPELNNRFELRFAYTGQGITITSTEPEVNGPAGLRVSTGRGYVEIAAANNIAALNITDPAGRRVYYNPGVNSRQVRISLPGGRIYIIEAEVNGSRLVRKVIIK